MYFTREELTAVLFDPTKQKEWFHESFKDIYSANCEAVIAYLTGESKTLSRVQPHPINHEFRSLDALLEDDVNSPRMKRMLDLFQDKDLQETLLRVFTSHWQKRLTEIDTSEYLQSLQAIYQQTTGPTPQYFADGLLNLVANDYPSYVRINHPDSPTKEFLVKVVRTMSGNSFPPLSRYSDVTWSLALFLLIEEARPEWLQTYIREATNDEKSEPFMRIAGYADGKYMDWLLAIIQNNISSDTDGYTKTFPKAYALFLTDQKRFLPLLVEVSQLYFDYYDKEYRNLDYYEHCLDFKIHRGKDQEAEMLGYSGCAMHFLFLHDREIAIKRMEDWKQLKSNPMADVFDILYFHLKEESLPYFSFWLSPKIDTAGYYDNFMPAFCRYFLLKEHAGLFWKLVDSKSKPVREAAATTIAKFDKDAVSHAIPLMNHKKASTRLFASIVLSHFDTTEARAAVSEVLDKESNDETRDLLLGTAQDAQPREMDKPAVKALIATAAKRGKLGKPVSPFLDASTLPGLTWSDGEPLPVEDISFLLYRMSRSNANSIDAEAGFLLGLLDRQSSGPFATEILNRFIANNSPAQQKYLLPLSALLGDDDIIDQIQSHIHKCIDNARWKVAEYGIAALALQGSDKALRRLDTFSRKFATKKAVIGAAATAALEVAAEQKGLSLHELGDRIVPDFGFDGLFLPFTAGGEDYRAFIDGNFKLTFFNDSNKKIKAVPAAATEEQKQLFKSITKEVKEIVKAQSSRLEFYLITQRKWTLEQWQQLFLNNPVMFIYASRLLWGVYDSDMEQPPVNVFLCEEDTTLIDLNDDELSIDTDKYIGILHPSHLDEISLKKWQEKLFDRDITPIFPQLDRLKADLSHIDLSATILKKFDGRETKIGSIRSTLESKGWRKGQTIDGGYIDHFTLQHRGKKLDVILEVEGVSVTYGWSAEEKLGRLYIIDKTKPQSGWLNIKNEKDPLLVPLKNLPSIFLHELIAAIESIKPA